MCRQSHKERVAVVRAAQIEMGIPERDRLPADGAILPAAGAAPAQMMVAPAPAALPAPAAATAPAPAAMSSAAASAPEQPLALTDRSNRQQTPCNINSIGGDWLASDDTGEVGTFSLVVGTAGKVSASGDDNFGRFTRASFTVENKMLSCKEVIEADEDNEEEAVRWGAKYDAEQDSFRGIWKGNKTIPFTAIRKG
eukprot:COSAG04_NODE_1184_length_7885_cov_98.186874_5_plen_196_part_00